MSKSIVSKTTAILMGLSLFYIASYPVIAQDATTAGTARKPLIQQKVNIRQERTEDAVGILQEKLASRAAALKTRLQAFKDTKKAEIAGRINTNLNRINQNQTSRMQKHLKTMSDILGKLEARINRKSPDIKDPEAAGAAISAARSTIASASAAVSAQTEKDYTVQVTSEAKIRTDIKTQRDKLYTDLQSTRRAVIDAKKSVSDAIRIAKSGSITPETGIKEGTISGQQ